MDDTKRNMLLIKSLDNDASLRLSEYTEGWYVSARIEVVNGSFLTGPNFHGDTPDRPVCLGSTRHEKS